MSEDALNGRPGLMNTTDETILVGLNFAYMERVEIHRTSGKLKIISCLYNSVKLPDIEIILPPLAASFCFDGPVIAFYDSRDVRVSNYRPIVYERFN